ncbi:MAG: tetratricopeptide repeat protein [Pirellulales bacterium]|nr:tetratricopeptide repeat protein [Planctomycetales bacterium]
MAVEQRVRRKRILREAEGYLELGMPQHALAALSRLDRESSGRSDALYLEGEALRSLGRYGEALVPLEAAADVAPSNVHIWLALAWCYKRTNQLPRAIEALEQARDVDPDDALLLYNLACYWSLAGEVEQAVDYLGRAFERDPNYRELVADESDFDPIRNRPEFQALLTIIV